MLDTNDFVKCILDLTMLIAKLNAALEQEQKARIALQEQLMKRQANQGAQAEEAKGSNA